MNKKILIASLFATLMLLVPMTSVVGVSDVSLNRKIEKIEDNNTITETYNNEDCGCQPVSSQHLDRLERLLNRIEIYNKFISILSKHNPEIKEKCEELSNKITTLSEMNGVIKSYSSFKFRPILCAMLYPLFMALMSQYVFLMFLSDELEFNYPKLYEILGGTIHSLMHKLWEIIEDVFDLMEEYCSIWPY